MKYSSTTSEFQSPKILISSIIETPFVERNTPLNRQAGEFMLTFLLSGLEFAYTQSPADLRGVVMGLCLSMIGFGYYLASALASIVKHASNGDWYPENLNKGYLEYYMFLLAGLMLVNASVFLFLAVRYRYLNHDREMNVTCPRTIFTEITVSDLQRDSRVIATALM